jgi:hypothetical protein
MLLNQKLFVHIPKNAGMTIRKSPMLAGRVITATPENHKSKQYSDAVYAHMNKIGDHHGFEHARWRDWKPSLTSAYDAFAVVRNPWDRVVSRYFFAKKVIEVEKKEPVGKHPINSFEEFLEDRHKWGGMEYMWHRAIRGWYPAYDYVTDEQGNIRCDCLRFEDLDNELKLYFKLLEMSRARNVTDLNKGTYRDLYTPQTIQIVADWYKVDIDTWGFDFDTGATKNYWSQTL